MYVHFPSSQHVVGTKKYLNLAKHRSWMGHRFSGLRQFPLKNISKCALFFARGLRKDMLLLSTIQFILSKVQKSQEQSTKMQVNVIF